MDDDVRHREHALRGLNEILGIADEVWRNERRKMIGAGTPEEVIEATGPLLREVIHGAVEAGWKAGTAAGRDWATAAYGRIARQRGLSLDWWPPDGP